MNMRIQYSKPLDSIHRSIVNSLLIAMFGLFLLSDTASANAHRNYLEENSNRYTAYAQKNPEKTYEEVLIEVNLHLDEKNYKNITVSETPESLSVLVTKHYSLPRDYKPKNLVAVNRNYAQSGVMLRQECHDAFLAMAQDMEAAGLTPYIKSGYRTNSKRGDANSLWYAWPGHSEHQTGLAFDLRKKNVTYKTMTEYKYQNTDEFAWLCNNAHRYGFILSFPKGKSEITGFNFEPWHWRYIGVDIATRMKALGIQTYHEYWASYLVE